MKVSRRHFLRANGAVLTLPFLHSISPALAAVSAKETVTPDKKLLVVYIPNGIVRRCFFPGEEQGELPGFIGGFNADKIKNDKRIQNDPGIYPLEFTSTMQPLREHTEDVTLITGLDRTFKNGQRRPRARGVLLPHESLAGPGRREGHPASERAQPRSGHRRRRRRQDRLPNARGELQRVQGRQGIDLLRQHLVVRSGPHRAVHQRIRESSTSDSSWPTVTANT